VQRNDPRLLDLSVRQSRADIGQLDAQIALRNRELASEIRRSLNQAESTRRVIRELTASSESRRNLHQQELTEFLAGNETVENLIQARRQLFMTMEDLNEEVFEFYDVALDLDEASGQFFVQLGDLIPQFESIEGNGGSTSVPRFGR
jgi:outer membrane protein TolC